MGTDPAASTAADPPLEPPGEHSMFQGLRVVPNSRLVVTAVWPNAVVFVRPITIALAAGSLATTTSSGSASSNRRLPKVVTEPAQSRSGAGPHVDDAARWVLDQCVVEELLQRVRAAAVAPGT